MHRRFVPFALSLVACTTTPTQLIVRVESELDAPGEIDTLRVEASVDGIERDYVRKLSGEDAITFPYAITLGQGRDDEKTDVCKVEAKLGDTVRSQLSARTSFVSGRRAELTLVFERACLDVACADGQTCAAGLCVSDEVARERLVITGEEAL